MGSRTTITKTVVDRLPPGSTVWDTQVRGFGVRKQRRDPVYVVKYRAGGKQRLYTIGRHGSPWTAETARDKARELWGEIAKGGDPATVRDRMRAAPSFSDFAEKYMVEVSRVHKKASTARGDRRMFDLHLMPAFGDRKVCDIDRDDVARWHAGLKQTPVAANRTLSLLSHMFNYAAEKGERAENTNPCQRIRRYAERGRERFLSLAELGRLGAAIQEAETTGIPWEPNPLGKVKHTTKPENRRPAKIDQFTAAALRLLLFTGARVREILHLKWANVDCDRGILFLDDSKTGRKTIVLNAPSLAVLATLPRVGAYVFPGDAASTPKKWRSEAGNTAEKPRDNVKRAWTTIRRRAGLEGVRLHDLRHTFASVGAGASLGLPIVGKLLGKL